MMELPNPDNDHISYRKGYIQALKTVLNVDPETINNNPIKENVK